MNSTNVEYKPPVPPHRNIGVTANIIGQPAAQRVGNKNIIFEVHEENMMKKKTLETFPMKIKIQF